MVNIIKHLNKILTISLFLICFQLTYGQDTIPQKNNLVQEAHYKKLKLEDFKISNKSHFKVSAFSVEKTLVNNTHHWFLQVLTDENNYVNYGKVNLLKGYLKDDATIKFKFMKPIVSLCNEGKYIIGFVNVKTAGVYKLLLEIENFGVIDKINVELTINNNESNKQNPRKT